jgi:hypothetical protein
MEDRTRPSVRVRCDVERVVDDLRITFVSHEAMNILRHATEYRLEQLKRRQARKDARDYVPDKVRKAESLVGLVSSFLFDLARQDNQRLETVQESGEAMYKAQTCLERHKKDTVQSLKTFLS